MISLGTIAVMLRLRLTLLALCASAWSCDRPPLFTVRSAVALPAAQPTFVLQWDSSELRHPRLDTFAFNGSTFVRGAGMTVGFVHSSTVIAAVDAPSPVLVHQSGTTLFATGPDGYVLAPAFARASLSTLGRSFVAVDSTGAAQGGPQLLSLDDRGRERWRRAAPEGTSYCRATSVTTPDRTRAVLLSASACVGASVVYAWDEAGTMLPAIEHDPVTLPDRETLIASIAAVRDDLSVAIASSFIDQSVTTRRSKGSVFLLRSTDRTPLRVALGDFVPSNVAPIGVSRWLLTGTMYRYQEHSARSGGYTTTLATTDAVVVTDAGAIETQFTLQPNEFYGVAMVATPRATALVTVPRSSSNTRPRLVTFAPDGRRIADETLDLDAVAAEVEPPLPSASAR